MTDLLPCPFCGSDNIKSYQTDMGVGMQTSTVSCKSCKAEMSLCSLNAISSWNTRAHPQTVDVDSIAAEHERVKKERDELAGKLNKVVCGICNKHITSKSDESHNCYGVHEWCELECESI